LAYSDRVRFVPNRDRAVRQSQSVAPDGRKQRGLYGRLADDNALEFAYSNGYTQPL